MGRASSAFILRFTASGQRRKSSKLRSAPFIFLFFTHAANVQKRKTPHKLCSVFLVENAGIEPVTSCMPCKRSPERYQNAPPHESVGTGLILRCYVLSIKRFIATPCFQESCSAYKAIYHPIFKCVNGFCSERRSFTRKVFSDSLLSAILILHIKVALFIFPKSIDKEVFSTMPMYYRCFLSVNQPHDP